MFHFCINWLVQYAALWYRKVVTGGGDSRPLFALIEPRIVISDSNTGPLNKKANQYQLSWTGREALPNCTF